MYEAVLFWFARIVGRTNLQLGKWSDWFESGLDPDDSP